MTLPPLLELAETVADASGGGGGDDDDEDAANELAPALARAVDDVFSSAGFLVEGFASPRPPVRTRDRDDEAARDITDALDIVSVDATYDALVRTRRPEVVTALAVALARLLDDLDDALTRYWTRVDDEFDGVTVPDEALYKDEMLTLTRAATIAWRSPLMRDAAFGDALVPRLVGVVVSTRARRRQGGRVVRASRRDAARG